MSPELDELRVYVTTAMPSHYPAFTFECTEGDKGELQIWCLRKWSDEKRGNYPYQTVRPHGDEFAVGQRRYKTLRGVKAYVKEQLSKYCDRWLEYREQANAEKKHDELAQQELTKLHKTLTDIGLSPHIRWQEGRARESQLIVTTERLQFWAEVTICADGRPRVSLRYPIATTDPDTLCNALAAM